MMPFKENMPSARLFRVREVELNNNPPAGDFKDDFGYSPVVDPHIGAQSALALLMPVTFPPIAEIPILEG